MIGKPPIRFFPTEMAYNNPEKTNVFSTFLNLDSSTTAEKEKLAEWKRERVRRRARIANCDLTLSKCVPDIQKATSSGQHN